MTKKTDTEILADVIHAGEDEIVRLTDENSQLVEQVADLQIKLQLATIQRDETIMKARQVAAYANHHFAPEHPT